MEVIVWAFTSLKTELLFAIRKWCTIVPVFLQPYAHETILLVSNLIGSVLLIIAGVTGTAKAKKRQALRQKLERIGS